jgi:hypothetical protein
MIAPTAEASETRAASAGAPTAAHARGDRADGNSTQQAMAAGGQAPNGVMAAGPAQIGRNSVVCNGW